MTLSMPPEAALGRRWRQSAPSIGSRMIGRRRAGRLQWYVLPLQRMCCGWTGRTPRTELSACGGVEGVGVP